MNVCCGYIVVIVFWSVEWSGEVDVGVRFCRNSECVEVSYVEDTELCHEWFCVRSGWYVFDESDDLLLCSDERFYVCLLLVGCAPDGDVADEMWEDVREVDISEDMRREEFVRVSDALDDGL